MKWWLIGQFDARPVFLKLLAVAVGYRLGEWIAYWMR